MVDKKTSVIAVLCVTTVLFLGLWVNAGQEAQKLGGELGELEDDYEKLSRVRTSLEENYSKLRTEKENLETENSILEKRCVALKGEWDSLWDTYEILRDQSLATLKEYNTLKEKYDELNSTTEAGKAIAESAEWVSEDERLKVKSKLITSGTWFVTYTVRVTVTNIGSNPIDECWIFLFPYVDGELCEYWNVFSYIYSVESLYIGETYSHDFTYLTEEMTSYKVLAVAG